RQVQLHQLHGGRAAVHRADHPAGPVDRPDRGPHRAPAGPGRSRVIRPGRRAAARAETSADAGAPAAGAAPGDAPARDTPAGDAAPGAAPATDAPTSGTAPTGSSGSTGAPVLQITGLRKEYAGHAVLSDVDLSVSTHEVVALIGASGS